MLSAAPHVKNLAVLLEANLHSPLPEAAAADVEAVLADKALAGAADAAGAGALAVAARAGVDEVGHLGRARSEA